MIDDEEPEIIDPTLRVLKQDVPPLKSDVGYVLDRASQETAMQVRRLNDLGALGVLEVRASFAKLASQRASAELELARLADSNPWLVSGVPTQPRSWKGAGVVAFAAVLVVGVLAAALSRPAPPSSAPDANAGQYLRQEAATSQQGRVEQ